MIDDKITECVKGLHFPERIYLWSLMRSYYAHCAICGTEYRVRTDEEKEAGYD